MVETARERLGRLVRARREHLGLTQEQTARKGGSNLTTLGHIERAVDERISTKTRQRLEAALQWEPGTIDAVLAKRLPKATERRLVVGPSGVAIGGAAEDERELLARLSDAALLEELARRMRH